MYLEAKSTISACVVLNHPDTFVATEEDLSRRGIAISDRALSLTQKRGICIYKIGITRDPYYHMYNPDFGYTQRGELYDRMDLLVASYPAVCGHLERVRIGRLQGRPGCRNDNPGGESAPDSGICYLYMVSLPCGDGRPIPKR